MSTTLTLSALTLGLVCLLIFVGRLPALATAAHVFAGVGCDGLLGRRTCTKSLSEAEDAGPVDVGELCAVEPAMACCDRASAVSILMDCWMGAGKVLVAVILEVKLQLLGSYVR